MKSSRLFLSALMIPVLLCAVVFTGCAASGQQTAARTAICFDTVISVTLYGNSSEQTGNEELLDDCFAIAEKAERLFDADDPQSDISRINAHPFEAVSVDPDTAELLERALYWCRESRGRFDITVGKLTALWNIPEQAKGTADAALPEASAISAAVKGIDYTCVEIRENNVTLKSDACAIDVGGIAKGFVADQMRDYLTDSGVEHALINLGGNVLCIGGRPDGTAFRIGIQQPFAADGTAATVVSLTDGSAVTSGTYQRYVEADGRRYHHLLDVTTGWPADTGLDSVTVFCDSSTDADALSTILFLLGEDEAQLFLDRHPEAEALFIRTDGTLDSTYKQ